MGKKWHLHCCHHVFNFLLIYLYTDEYLSHVRGGETRRSLVDFASNLPPKLGEIVRALTLFHLNRLARAAIADMRNRRLTLAVPPYTVSPQKSCRPRKPPDPGACSGGHQNSVRKTPPLSASSVRATSMNLEMDLIDWLNAEHFSPVEFSSQHH